MVIWMHLTGRPVWQEPPSWWCCVPRHVPQATMQPHETIASQGATQRFQRQPFSSVTHSTPS
jgi:hypothetical protein